MNCYPILIIDDSEDDRFLLKRQIKDTQIECLVHEIDNGRSAIDYLSNHNEFKAGHSEKFPPHLMFLDINMPRVDGFQFLKEFGVLRQHDRRFNSTSVIVFTSSERDRDKNKSLSHACVKGFVTKGLISTHELKDMMIHALAILN